ncbi:xanthine dehydrogenase accessory protein XdhC [Roseobacter sp.]|uniref:xanthine dehydrogenase accessory protein XdhC n=1 Tax=Roseobacter sp. TaxID=1907202 RepID=UPI0025E01D36|nr:xanthine dehydrogenase accessory protein XdhC [Roseobacter sp.]
MSFDREALIAACVARGVVARIVVASVAGSAPRETGAAMLVWQDGQSGTIGGGALEHSATLAARAALTPGHRDLSRHALGPDLGQCCGGAVQVLTEVYDEASARALPEDVIMRGPGAPPLAVSRLRARIRTGQPVQTMLTGNWFVEPVSRPERAVWIWGAGHVGRALAQVLAPLPGTSVSWVDTAADRFPGDVPEGVTVVPAANPALMVRHAPLHAEHLIVTFSHALDLELCHRLLAHGFGFAGLIGSATKRARFHKRLAALGHSPQSIARLTCPIGQPDLGRDPQAIAIGVAAQMLQPARSGTKPLKDSA